MRTPPPPPPALQWKTRKHDDRQYRFLTYVFGGGVEVKDHEKRGDPVTPVRVASIRGQLRFWWRACNPSRCESVEELRRREGEIWGTTGQASKVEITVLSQPSSPDKLHVFKYNPNHRLTYREGMKDIAYGAFPLQPSSEAQQRDSTQPWHLFDYGNATFSLRFTYPDTYRKDVEAALWAWETFGGLGGRTRRGFGAIARVNSPSLRNVEAELVVWRESPRIDRVPSLHQARFALASRSKTSAIEAWKDGLRLLRQMRQEGGFGRKSSQDPQSPGGRSLWPEPDEIRRLTGKFAPNHKQPVTAVSRFPRAVFGMPIVFHFKDAGDPNMKRLELRPIDAERFASPLIIRPIADARGFRAAALVLSSTIPRAELVAGDDAHPADFTLDLSLAREIQPLKRNGKVFTDPLELFLSELKK